MKRGRQRKFWDEVVKEDMKKRGLVINDAQDTMLQKSGQHRLLGRRSCYQGRTEMKKKVFMALYNYC